MVLSIKDNLGCHYVAEFNGNDDELNEYTINLAKRGEKIIGIWD